MKLIERGQYLEKMISVIGTPNIKVIAGVRRNDEHQYEGIKMIDIADWLLGFRK